MPFSRVIVKTGTEGWPCPARQALGKRCRSIHQGEVLPHSPVQAADRVATLRHAGPLPTLCRPFLPASSRLPAGRPGKF
jgi:hypothetical protein